jgi:hypothetical protein
MAAFQQIEDHWAPHDAEADKTDFHPALLFGA